MRQKSLYLIVVIGLVTGLVACGSKNQVQSAEPNSDCDSCPAPRSFNINPSKTNFYVSVFGRKLATPDYEAVNSFLQFKKASGEINELSILVEGIEGGARYCVVVHDDFIRIEILDYLIHFSTDLEETSYSVESTEDCSQL